MQQLSSFYHHCSPIQLYNEAVCWYFSVFFSIWAFPKIGVKPPKWMVKIMENPMNKWMIWGENPPFKEQPYVSAFSILPGAGCFFHHWVPSVSTNVPCHQWLLLHCKSPGCWRKWKTSNYNPVTPQVFFHCFAPSKKKAKSQLPTIIFVKDLFKIDGCNEIYL